MIPTLGTGQLTVSVIQMEMSGQLIGAGLAGVTAISPATPAGTSNWIIQKSAQEPHGAELYGKPQPHMIPTLGTGQLTVSVIQMEMSGQLIGAGLAGVTAISPLLLRCQE